MGKTTNLNWWVDPGFQGPINSITPKGGFFKIMAINIHCQGQKGTGSSLRLEWSWVKKIVENIIPRERCTTFSIGEVFFQLPFTQTKGVLTSAGWPPNDETPGSWAKASNVARPFQPRPKNRKQFLEGLFGATKICLVRFCFKRFLLSASVEFGEKQWFLVHIYIYIYIFFFFLLFLLSTWPCR